MRNLQESDLYVIKVGTNTLKEQGGDGHDGLDEASFARISEQAKQLKEFGASVLIVSSGAITAGAIDDGKRREDLSDVIEEQRYALHGWDILVQKWKQYLEPNKVGSALLTRHDLEHASTREQALGVIARCHVWEDMFLVNENDAITSEEIKFGDNDQLAAHVAAALASSGLYRQTKLFLLTDVHSFNEVAHDDRTRIDTVTNLEDVWHFAGGAKDEHSRGGMQSKLLAAEIAAAAGVQTWIVNGRADDGIKRAESGEIATHFALV